MYVDVRLLSIRRTRYLSINLNILRLLFRCIYAAIVSKSLYYAPWLAGWVFAMYHECIQINNE